MCGNSKWSSIQKIKNFSGEVNWVHQALSAISSDENNVNKHTTFCDVRKLLKDRYKST